MRILLLTSLLAALLGSSINSVNAQTPNEASNQGAALQDDATNTETTALKQISVLHPLRAGVTISLTDLAIPTPTSPQVREFLDHIIGKSAKHNLYPGKPITLHDIAPLQVVSRNDIVSIEFTKGPLELYASGRALGTGAVGDPIRVMNIDSKAILQGIVTSKGTVTIR